MWIVKDDYDTFWLYENKPEKYGSDWGIITGDAMSISNELARDIVGNISCEDEPKEVFLNTGFSMAEQINHVWGMYKALSDECCRLREENVILLDKIEKIKLTLK